MAGALFALACIAYLFPVLIGGRVLSPATMLYDVAPWAPYGHPWPFGEHNSILSDHPTAFHPWLEFARENVRAGHLPLWNPYVLSGSPFAGNAQAALFSPFTLPVYLLPLKYAFGLQAALRLLVAALGAYGLARQLRLSFWPAVVTGLSYGFAPVLIIWLSHPHTNVLVLVPWVLWFLERLLDRGRPRDAILLALPVAVAMLGGHPGSQLHLLAGAGVYAVVRLLVLDAPAKDRLRRGGLALAGLAAGLALAAIALLPAYLLVPGSSGVEGRTGGGPVIPGSAFRTLFFPDWWGRPSALNLGGPFNYSERTLYAGAVALVLAILGLTRVRDWRRWLPFVVLGFLGLVVPLGVFPFHDIAAELPLLGNVQNARLTFFFALAVAVLAGFGTEHLLADRAAIRPALAVALVALAVGLVALVASDVSVDDLRTATNHFRTGTDFAGRPGVITATSILWWLGLVAATLLVVVAVARRAPAAVVVVALLALVALDLGHFARGYQPMPKARDVFPEPEPPAVRALTRLAGDDRVTAISTILPPDSGMVEGLRDIRGHDPPEPDTRYLELYRLGNPAQSAAAFLSMPSLTPGARRVMDILGVRYVLDRAGAPAHPQPGLDAVYTGADGTIYRNARAPARAYVPSAISTARDARASLRALAAPAFRAGRDAIVETSGSPPAAADGDVAVTAETQDRVALRTELDRGGLVVLNDRLKDGWSVTVDGKRAKPLRVNSVVRGVNVPAGTHRVVWSYAAPGLLPGAIVSLVAALALIAAAVVLRQRRNR